jgi:5-oxoprolinase (ATP-hydrolysing) subunit A
VNVESVCVHGDSPGAVRIATAVRDRLKAGNTDLKAFC